MKRVLFAAFESLPFVKTGGLADVIYALPRAIDKEKYEVKVVLPLFKKIKKNYGEKLKHLNHIVVKTGSIDEKAEVYSFKTGGIDYLFIENDKFFNRDDVYGYDDDVLRFCFYNVAIVEMLIQTGYYPDIVHCHDYHTALFAALCKLKYSENENIKKIKHVFTIHNLIYQGRYGKQILTDYLGFDHKYYEDGTLRYNDECNLMKIGIVMSDIVTTVSKTYAKEIQMPEYGEGLDFVLKYRQEDLYGVVNGIDEKLFDPKKDQIYKNYSLKTHVKGKAFNKEALQEEMGLEKDPDAMLVAVISRLTYQKGMDLVVQSIEDILKKHVQLIVLGSGESKYEYAFKTMEQKHPGQAVFHCEYNENLAHKIYAGSDMLLMPSRFEPCGLSQLIAMRYGTLPLVRETGGLKDTVEPYNKYTKEGRGFSFAPFSAWDMMYVFNIANRVYENKPSDWRMLVKNAMAYNVSFGTSAKEYEELYEKVLG
ncbi:MAG: glycogen/starch synthase [Erysipelotrichaceae bacterium]|nr:glycogen/starch synthase [Erysipelotrichaceae bacterium]